MAMSSSIDILRICSGVGSQLQAAGFRRVRNLAGGILRWSADVDPSVPRY